EDLKKLPILTKEKLKSLPVQAFIHKSYYDTYQNEFSDSTSGSTGIPLTVYRLKQERFFQIAKWLRVLFYNGYTPFDKILSLTSKTRLKEGKSFIQKFNLFRRKAIDYNLPTKEIINEIISYKPNIIYGNKVNFDMLCNAIERESLSLNLKFIAVTGEVIPKNTMDRYKKVFNARIVESYGSVEMGVMAYQLDDEADLTLNEDFTIFEFLDENRKNAEPEEKASIVVTDLCGELMPFIRYDQGDFASYKKMGNGKTFIKKIYGREDDLAILPNGEILTCLVFYAIMDKYIEINQFRIIQKTISMFDILIVSDNDYFKNILSKLETDLKAISKQQIVFNIKNVNDIPSDPNGKMRIFISEVS
ncbi:MAG: hypothetical protein KAI79_20295, partial [Bacteroidales bacterium]|nr:hypothetical protein [Bacteroidales bacterium]